VVPATDNPEMSDLPRPLDTEPELVRLCRDRLADAAAGFRAGEFRSSAEAALEAGGLATKAGRLDLLAEAALVEAGIPDPATAPIVERLCRDAIGLIGGGDTSMRARLHGQLAVALHHRGRLEEANAEVERALTFAGEAGDPRALAAALNARQFAMAGLGHGRELLALGDRMLDAAAAAGSVEIELQARNWRIDAFFRLGDTTGAAHEIDSLDVLAARTGDSLVRWNARLSRAGLAHAVGRLGEAERLAREAREILPPQQRPQTEPLFIAQLLLIATDLGVEPPEIGLARGFTIGGHQIAVAMTGRYDLEMGDLARARAAFEAVRPRLASVAMDRRGLATLTGALELAVAFGDAAIASEMHARLAPFETTMIASAIGAVGPVSYFLARAEPLMDRHDDAVTHAQAAIEMSARGNLGPWLARSRLALAEALLLRDAGGDRDAARRSATLAAVTARELGMTPVLTRALALVDRLGLERRLSRREREVAGLVAAGSSNRDMARSLGLSERTVETHVQNVLTKLGFHSRTQIAAWAVAEGIGADGPATDPRRT
jgi:DNA-binding CsgD family transcriptional regulator/tetratricopeptide (TPR) repeat protein